MKNQKRARKMGLKKWDELTAQERLRFMLSGCHPSNRPVKPEEVWWKVDEKTGEVSFLDFIPVIK